MEAVNRRVAKNAIVLSLRTLLSICVGLYTSRLVLQALGIDDFGIFGVVGGIVGMSSFLNGSMAGTTSRFITYELGCGNNGKLKQIFTTAFWTHLFLAGVVIVIAETVGLWFLNYKMIIPEGSMFAANIVYQFSVLAIVIGFTQVPYSSAIIAHEDMSFYAYLEIINVTLKLLCAIFLFAIESQRLILYSFMIFGISLIMTIITRLYCLRKYPEAKLSLSYDKTVAKELVAYCGNDLYANICLTAKDYGLPLLLNIFFGVVANAASSITSTVSGSIVALTTTVSQAFRPQIIKQYASGNIILMAQMMRRSVQFSLMFFSYVAIPFIIMTPEILQLWLGEEPTYASTFLQLVMCSAIFNIMNNASIASIHATGKIRRMSIIAGTFALGCPVTSYILLKAGAGVNTPYAVNIAMFACILIANWSIIKKRIPQFALRPYIWALTRSLAAIGLSIAIMYIIKCNLFNKYLINGSWSWMGLFVILALFTILSIGCQTFITYVIALNKAEKDYLRSLLLQKIRKISI